MRCVILQDEPRCLKILWDSSFEFVLLGWRLSHQTWFLYRSVPNITNHLCILREGIHSAKIGIGDFIIGQYPILQNGRTEGFKVDWYPPQLKTCCMFPGEIPLFIRQANFMRKSAQVTSKLHPCSDLQRGLRYHLLGVIFYIYTTKKFEHFFENNYIISLTIEARHPCHHSIKNAHFNNKFLPSLIGIFSLNVDESVSANFGRLSSLWFQGPKKARLEHSRPLLSMKGLNIVVNILLLLTSVEALLNFFCIVSLESLMVTNDLWNWTPFTNWTPRTNWTPDCFVPAKVKLLKIIKKR